MTVEEEFSVRPFVAGSVFGLRAFTVDGLGRLTGVVHRQVWTPGLNEAVHDGPLPRLRAVEVVVGQHFDGRTTITYPTSTTYGRGGRKTQPAKPSPPLHEVAGKNCTCGFYAYWDGGNDYYGGPVNVPNTIMGLYYGQAVYSSTGVQERVQASGIIEGFGLVTLGSRGFKASKATLTALVLEDTDDAKGAIRLDRVRSNYPGLPIYDTEAEAVRAHPLTDPDPVAPDTSQNFWTRNA